MGVPRSKIFLPSKFICYEKYEPVLAATYYLQIISYMILRALLAGVTCDQVDDPGTHQNMELGCGRALPGLH